MAEERTEVNLHLYCTAFWALDYDFGYSLCKELWAEDSRVPDEILRGEPGDGFIEIKSAAEDKVIHTFSDKGNLDDDESVERVFDDRDFDPRASRYFIAGAFGIDELRSSEGIDPALVGALQFHYEICETFGNSCSDTDIAEFIGQQWDRIELGYLDLTWRAIKRRDGLFSPIREKWQDEIARLKKMISINEKRTKEFKGGIDRNEACPFYQFSTVYNRVIKAMPTSPWLGEQACIARNRMQAAKHLFDKSLDWDRKHCIERPDGKMDVEKCEKWTEIYRQYKEEALWNGVERYITKECVED